MRIIECYVRGFGALKNMRIEFDRGLNGFVGDNGIGKSTVLAFIKAMLYGLGETRKTSIEENDRKHYIPWDGTAAGGTLTFVADGKQYRIERSFGKRPADDTFALYDTRLGKESKDFGSNLGEALFGIDAEGFERTAYFSERNLVPEADIASSGAATEDGAFAELSSGALAEALALLDEQRKFYQKKGGGGAISELKAEIGGIDADLERLASVKARAKETEARLSELTAKRAVAEAESRSISERRGRLQARAAMQQAEVRIRDIKNELLSLNEKKDGLIEFFGGNIPSRSELDELEYKSKRAAELKAGEAAYKARDLEEEKLSALLRDKTDEREIEAVRQAIAVSAAPFDERAEKCDRIFSKRIPDPVETDTLIALQTAKPGMNWLIAVILGLVLCTIGAILGMTFNYLFFALCGGGALTTVLGIILGVFSASRLSAEKKSSAKKFLESIGDTSSLPASSLPALIEIKGMIEEVSARRDKLKAASALLEGFAAKFQLPQGTDLEKSKLIIEKYDRMKMLSESGNGRREINPAIEAEGLRLEIAEALSAYKITTDNPILEAKESEESYRLITERIISLNKELANLRSMSVLNGIDEPMTDTPESLDSAARASSAALASCDGELAILNREYDRDLRALDDEEGLSIERLRLADKLAEYESRLRTIQATQSYLKQAADAMNEKYLSGALASFKKYSRNLGLLEEGAEIKTDYSTSIADGSGTHSTESFSRGSRDGYRLAARLAILDSIYTGEMPPIILDDPFLSFDDERVAAALALIDKISEERQVIYLTCSEARAAKGSRELA